MGELRGINFDSLCSLTMNIFSDDKKSNAHAWGLGWYHQDERSASTIRNAGSKNSSALAKKLSDWHHFTSTNYLFKYITNPKPHSLAQHNTQPFHRTYGGMDWLFTHKGNLDRNTLVRELEISQTFEPLGTTDSELVFCAFLNYMKSLKLKRIADLPFEEVNAWFTKCNQYGNANIIITDSQSMLIYHDINNNDPLYYGRVRPPNFNGIFTSEHATFTAKDHNIAYRTCFVATTNKLNDGIAWMEMVPSQMLVVRRGNVLWNSHIGTASMNDICLDKAAVVIEQQPDLIGNTENKEIEAQILNVKATTRTEDGAALHYKSYKVIHETTYSYEKPVGSSSHVLHLQPVDDSIQEVIRSTLTLSVDSEKIAYEDVFGNHTTYLKIDNPYESLTVRCESDVKIFACPPDNYSMRIRRSSIPLVWMPWQRQMMLPYLLPPELPETQLMELTNFAMSIVERNDYCLLDTLNDMNRQIYQDFEYTPGATHVQTTPFEVLTTHKGVCQDFANLFICLARLLSIPARYRVGYIYTGANYENKIQSDASHAWVEVYLPYIGWRGFDPTNGCMVSQDHIRVACGRHFFDATPTAGTIFIGGHGETLNVSVQVTETVI